MTSENSLPVDVLFQRTNRTGNTFYLRKVRGAKNYPAEIKEKDNLILLGVFEPVYGTKMEWAYSFEDQYRMWAEVMRGVVSIEKRKRLLLAWKEKIEFALHTGTIDTTGIWEQITKK